MNSSIIIGNFLNDHNLSLINYLQSTPRFPLFSFRCELLILSILQGCSLTVEQKQQVIYDISRMTESEKDRVIQLLKVTSSFTNILSLCEPHTFMGVIFLSLSLSKKKGRKATPIKACTLHDFFTRETSIMRRVFRAKVESSNLVWRTICARPINASSVIWMRS